MKYFLYSEAQIEEKNKILANCGKRFVPGIISVQGKRCLFTQISDETEIPRFIDAKIIASVENLNTVVYVAPTTEAKIGG